MGGDHSEFRVQPSPALRPASPGRRWAAAGRSRLLTSPPGRFGRASNTNRALLPGPAISVGLPIRRTTVPVRVLQRPEVPHRSCKRRARRGATRWPVQSRWGRRAGRARYGRRGRGRRPRRECRCGWCPERGRRPGGTAPGSVASVHRPTCSDGNLRTGEMILCQRGDTLHAHTPAGLLTPALCGWERCRPRLGGHRLATWAARTSSITRSSRTTARCSSNAMARVGSHGVLGAAAESRGSATPAAQTGEGRAAVARERSGVPVATNGSFCRVHPALARGFWRTRRSANHGRDGASEASHEVQDSTGEVNYAVGTSADASPLSPRRHLSTWSRPTEAGQ
jgi:hypothetical protein